MRASILILIFSGLVSVKQCNLNNDIKVLPSFEKNNSIEASDNIDKSSHTESRKKSLLFTPFFFQSGEGENIPYITIINYN